MEQVTRQLVNSKYTNMTSITSQIAYVFCLPTLPFSKTNLMFLKDVTIAHHGCICFIKNRVKTVTM